MLKKRKTISLTVICIVLTALFTVLVSAATLGDLNGDGQITSADARLVLRAAVGLEQFDDAKKALADANGDGQITSADARLVLRAAVGLEQLAPAHTHSYGAYTVTKAAICTEAGTETSYCSCGEYLTRSIPATGHQANIVAPATVVAPGCTQNGYSGDLVCAVCGTKVADGNVIPALGHNFVADTARNVAATCTQTGIEAYSCSRCGAKDDKTTEALGHTVVTDNAVAPTCTTTGLTAGSHCSVCNAVITAQTTVPALGHTVVTDNAVAPTCTATGLTQGSHCSVCNAVLTAQTTVPALGHTVVKDNAVAPTCTATGLTQGSHCSVCNTVLVAQTEVPALGHTVVKDNAVAPTCLATGLTEGSHCSVCNTVITVQTTVPALGHTVVKDNAVAPTCLATGLTEGSHCSACDTVLVEQTTVPALGHKVVKDNAVAPTCLATGLTEGSHCSVCDTVLVEQTTVPALGHTSVTDEAVAPTCTATGLTEGSHCSVCNTVIVAQETVAALGHVTERESTRDVAAQCAVTGLEAYTRCTRCNAVCDIVTPALGHDFVRDVERDIAATCTEAGLEAYTCSRCPVTADKNVSALGHTVVIDEAVPATCVKTGLSEGSHCSVCSQVLIEQTQTPMIAHTYENKSETASCTAEGYTAEVCKYCGDFKNYVKTADPTGHTYDAGTVVAPTCTEDGSTYYTCTKCKAMYTDMSSIVPAFGHSWDETKEVVITAATCTEDGLVKSICSVCGATQETVDFAKGHTYVQSEVPGNCTQKTKIVATCNDCHDSYVVKETDYVHQLRKDNVNSYAATCTEDGLLAQICRNCSQRFDEAIPATGHKYSIVSFKNATCTQNGHAEYSGECSVCHALAPSEPVIFYATGHTPGAAATCTDAQKCTKCNEVLNNALGHDYKAATVFGTDTDVFYCTRCGELTGDTLGTFNTVANSIKKNFALNHSMTYFTGSSMTTKYSRFDFGIYTSEIKKLYDDDMAAPIVSYSPLRKGSSIYSNLQLTGKKDVSKLEAGDIDSIKIERFSSLDSSDFLSKFPDNYTTGSKTYDLSPYKTVKINAPVLKITIDVKNENYTDVKKLPADTLTSLQKIYNFDIRGDAEEYGEDGKLTETEGDGSYSITMDMGLSEIRSDATVIYYINAETYEPIAAVYDVSEVMDQTVEMTFKIGVFSLRGFIDPVITTNYSNVYLFSGYYN